MTTKLKYVELDVFTATRFLGNPLAIVHVPADLNPPLSQQQKLLIAREFNLSETVFLHEAADATSDSDAPVQVGIFTPEEELPFAGHPTVGSGWYLLSKAPHEETVTLRTRAGDIPVTRRGAKVQLQVPVDFKVHAPYAHPTVKAGQTRLRPEDFVNGLDGPEDVVSIVKGMTFYFLELASVEALGRLEAKAERISVPTLDNEWGTGFVGLYAFHEEEREGGADGNVIRVRARMFVGTLEDPATGSAGSALGGYLARKRGPGQWKVEIVQGVEMGRDSEIEIVVDVGKDNEVKRIQLGGGAVQVLEGNISL